ncbi:MAG: bifunctional hydroxymethylpyrimidine kinase/phosphomethylpyrimidine kinase [Candidatus Korobacteraceae bacterium]
MSDPPVVLSIAGYDPSSGAGITADIKTAASQGCFAVTCITALTVQSSQGVFGVQPLEPDLISRTLAALADDLEIAAVRIGMLGSGEIAEVVAKFLGKNKLPNVVLDPVMRSSSGTELLDRAGVEILRTKLIPLCDVVTPNINEAAILAGAEPLAAETSWDDALPQLRRWASRIHDLGSRGVVITGGHLRPANDYLSYESCCKSESLGENASEGSSGGFCEEVILGERLESRSTHGTGCAFAAALACQLALGRDLSQAVRAAKDYVRRAIVAAYPVGKGIGPVNHLV